MERTVYNALPKIPGFDFPELHPPATTRLPQLCTISLGGRTVLEAGARRRKGEEQANVGECGGLTRAEILDKFPQWKSMDDKVLRFFAYYVERVDESSLEKERVRKVKMCFFLVDGTVSVCETPATVNSGIRRGTTVSRCKVDGVDVFSLYVGASVRIRGLDYVIVDCDAATREFLAVMGMPQAEPYDYPTDAFETTIAATRQPADEHQAAMRRSMAAATRLETGTVTSVLTQEEREKARNFFEHDRKVLRFMGAWDNKMFRIQFYIADQTLSVMLEHVRNDGLDPNPVFIRRTKIPKCPTTRTRDTETLNLPLGPPIQYVGEDDLRTGKSVNLFTRDFYIFDCDEFTRTYYKARGIEQKPFPPPEVEVRTFMTEKSRKTVEISSTRKTVDGASTMTFEDKFVPKDCLKLVRYCNDVFRFAARIANPTPENEGRRFLFCYYLADDTVGMFEIPVPNSGHTGGKCFTRAPVPEINEPGKLCVGAHVKLAGTEYVLTEMDERTKRYIAMGMPNMDDGYFATQDLIGFAKQVIAQRFSRLTDAFRHFRSRKEGLTSVI
ncbi:DUF1126 PH like domain [Trypanosoma vivax]|nr:DUF1126 PH like domain [Trypanosoma vivax]